MKKTKQTLISIISLIILSFCVGSAHAVDYPGDYFIDNIDTSGDIAGLSLYTGVTGILSIEDTALTNLNGLENITTVGDLRIWHNDALTSLDGLGNITSVGWLSVVDNHSLISLNGLEGLTTVDRSLYIDNNNSLTTLAALSNLTSVSWDLNIRRNNSLASLNGLNNITSLDYSLEVYDNDVLTSLNGLNNITSVGDELYITKNDALTSLNGLENLTTVGYDLIIDDNTSLTNLCALYNITYIDNELYITYNTMLSMETAYALETQLRINGFTGDSDIDHNDGSGLVECDYPGDYFIDNIDTSGDIETLSGYKGVTGNLVITSTALTNLNGLENITSVGGYLDIWNNSLTSLTGLQNLTYVGEHLTIEYNPFLTDLCALYSANINGSTLLIFNNTLLSMDTAYALETQLRLNGFIGTSSISNNYGTEQVFCGPGRDIFGFTILSGNPAGGLNLGLYKNSCGTDVLIDETTSISNGLYLFSNLPNGSYKVIPGEDDYFFDPQFAVVQIPQIEAQTYDFTAFKKLKISGTVSGAVQEGVYMLIYKESCGTSTLEDYVLTSADGSYSFTGLSNGNYKVKPLKTGYAFSPMDQIVNISDYDVTGVDFFSY